MVSGRSGKSAGLSWAAAEAATVTATARVTIDPKIDEVLDMACLPEDMDVRR